MCSDLLRAALATILALGGVVAACAAWVPDAAGPPASGSPPRLFRVAAQQMGYHSSYGREQTVRHVAMAGEVHADLLVLTECCWGYGRPKEDTAPAPIPGRWTELLAPLAKQRRMYLIGWQNQSDPGYPAGYNSNFLLDRSGELVGVFHKLHYHKQVEAEPYPVFPTELGALGCHICMDGHYPEVHRALALNGAQLITLSTAPWGSEGPRLPELQMRAAALHNGVYVIMSSAGWLGDDPDVKVRCDPRNKEGYVSDLDHRSMVIDPSGTVIARGDSEAGLVLADIDPAREYWTRGDLGSKEPGRLRDIIFARRRPDTYAAITKPDRETHQPPANGRLVKAAAIQWGKDESLRAATRESRLALMARYLDEAGAAGCDMVVMPEGWCGWEAMPLQQGGVLALAQQKAQQHHMYVCGWQVEQSGGKRFNTALLVDPLGTLVGTYRKVHLDFQDEALGITAGSEYPTFATDFDQVAVLVGFDNVIFEAGRCLYVEGAHVVLTPISGLDELGREKADLLFGNQAYTSGLYIVAAANSAPSSTVVSTIYDTEGFAAQRAEAHDGPVIGSFDTQHIGQYRQWISEWRRPETYWRLTATRAGEALR